MDFVGSSVFKSYRSFLLYTGLWPYDNSVTKLIQRILYSLNLLLNLMPQIIAPFTSEMVVDLLFETAPIILIRLMIVLKFHLCWMKRDYYKECFEHMTIDWNRLKKNEESLLRQTYEEFIWYSKVLLVFAYGPAVLITVSLFLPKIADIDVPLNQSHLSNVIATFGNLVDCKKYFYPIAIHISLSSMLLSTLQCGVDLLNLIIILHVMGVFHILGYLLEHLFDEPEDTTDKIDLNTVYYRRLVHIINSHKRNLKLVAIMMKIHNVCSSHRHTECLRTCDTFLNGTFLRLSEISMQCMWVPGIVQIILSIPCITSMLMKLKKIVSPIQDVRILVYHCTLCSCFLTILYFTLMILQRIIDSSSNMFIKIYCGRWYMAPIKSKKLLLIPMQRYMKPYKVEFIKLIIANIQTFAKVIKAGFSYFMVLYSLQD